MDPYGSLAQETPNLLIETCLQFKTFSSSVNS
jgi:hypothetical protein